MPIPFKPKKQQQVLKGPPMPYATWDTTREVCFDVNQAVGSRAAAHREISRTVDKVIEEVNHMLPDPFTLMNATVSASDQAKGRIFLRMAIPTTRWQNIKFVVLSKIPFFGKMFDGPTISSRLGAK